VTRGRRPGDIRLTDVGFDTLHDLSRARDRSKMEAARRALTQPVRCARAAWLLWALPRRVVPWPDSCTSQELLGPIRGERMKRLWPFSVVPTLAIPPAGVSYLTGRSRQAVRTNAGKARAAGVTCSPVSAAQFVGLLDQLALSQLWAAADEMPALRAGMTAAPHRFFFAARYGCRPAVLAKVIVSGTRARLDMFVRDPTVEHSSEARYALMAEIVAYLQQRRVKELLVTNALELQRGLRFYGHLLGFAPVNVRIAAVAEEAPAG